MITNHSRQLPMPWCKVEHLNLNVCIYLNPHNMTPFFWRFRNKLAFYYAGKIHSVLGVKYHSTIGKWEIEDLFVRWFHQIFCKFRKKTAFYYASVLSHGFRYIINFSCPKRWFSEWLLFENIFLHNFLLKSDYGEMDVRFASLFWAHFWKRQMILFQIYQNILKGKRCVLQT